MRHLWSLLAGLILAPLTWVLLAYANAGLSTAAQLSDNDRRIIPMIIIAAAALLIGAIASLRISPLGPTIAGLILIGVTVFGLVAPVGLAKALPGLPKIDDLGDALLVTPVGTGQLLLVGGILVFAVFSAGRWKLWPTSPLHPTVGPVNPMVDTGRIEAIRSWSPVDSSTNESPTAATPTLTNPIVYTPEPPTNPIMTGSSDKDNTDGASPWAAPPTGR